ncbi:MAG: hypothetical protein JNL85_10205 [Rubrivivax sp.]|nr:hypothetical protein [Rubrivivax sp.]
MHSLSSKKGPGAAAVAVFALALAAPLPALADSFASSAISNSFSASVGSISTSFNASSDASSPGRPVRQGKYRVQEIVVAAGREGYLRLTLRAEKAGAAATAEATETAAADDTYHLYLPQETVARAAIAPGQQISARARPYGLELAKVAADGRSREAFFLVVDDERYRELQTRPVTL